MSGLIFPYHLEPCFIQFYHPDVYRLIEQEFDRVGGLVPYERGYVYAIQACGTSYFKFGKSVNPDRRILQISPKMPFDTKLVQVWPSNFMSIGEQWLHSQFEKQRVNGEWFELRDRDIAELFAFYCSEYAEAIRYAYGMQFLSRILPSAVDVQEFIKETSEIDERFYFGTFGGGNALTICWIEHLFDAMSVKNMHPLSVQIKLLAARVQESDRAEALAEKAFQQGV